MKSSTDDSLPLLFKDHRGKEWLVDQETGEMFLKSGVKKTPPLSPLYYGIDTKTIEECNTEDQLIEVVSMLDAYTGKDVYINYIYLTESVASGFITPMQLKLLLHILKNICVWNVFIGTRDDLLKADDNSKTLSKSLTKTLRDLEKFARVERIDSPYKGHYRITVNPFVAWKGDREWQEHYKNKWYDVDETIFSGKIR